MIGISVYTPATSATALRSSHKFRYLTHIDPLIPTLNVCFSAKWITKFQGSADDHRICI